MRQQSQISEGPRRRKGAKKNGASNGTETIKNGAPATNGKVEKSDDKPPPYSGGLWFTVLCSLCGLGALCASGGAYALLQAKLHENHLWFSNIQQVEREISLRTECGLYYSYFKEILAAQTFERGLFALTVDNATEHTRTINVLQRFNLYQEVVLAGLYTRLQPSMAPILFYVQSIFQLQGFYVMCLFALSWHASSSWLAGLLCVLFMAAGGEDASRVFFTVNLREAFAMPFLGAQMLCIHLLLEPVQRRAVTRCLLNFCNLLFCTLFALCWQFSQFVLFIQCGGIFVLGVLRVAPLCKCGRLLFTVVLSVLIAAVCQFLQPMLLGSLVLSFAPAAMFTLWLCQNATLSNDGMVEGAFRVFGQFLLCLVSTLACNWGVKRLLNLVPNLIHPKPDAHIYKFLMAKLGFSTPPTDFESRLYLCHGAFSYLDTDFFYRASWRLVFPLHAALVCTVLFYLFRDTILQWCGLSLATSPKRSANVSEKNVAATLEVPAATYRSAADGPPPAEPNLDYLCCRRPNLTLLVICSTLYGFLAMMALRFKYLWYPCMCVLASVCVADQRMWSWLIAKLPSRKHTDADSQSDSDTDSGIEGTRSKSSQTSTRGVLASVCVTLMAFGIASAQFYPTYVEWMRDLKEFWDPDTVELMQWIRAQTAPDASLAGSMQLMASVKACTSRHIANHPHFEDKWLRERTARLYQIYARAPPQKVHQILAQEKVDYIILEDSICLSRSSGCSTPDLVDLHNGHVPEYALLPAHQDVFRAFSEWIRTRLVPIYSLNSQNTSTNVHRVHLFLDFLGLSIWDEDAATALAATLLDTDLRREHTPRFCDQIRHLDDLPEFGEYFELLFENHTFRLYKVR